MKTHQPPPDPRTLVLFGLPFHDITLEETLAWIDHLIADRRASYLVTANLDFAAQASHDVELQRILLEAELVLCDGTPLVWASHMTGKPLRERVAGSDLVPRLMAHAEKRGYRIFLLGGEEEVLAKAAAKVMADHPLLPTVECYSPPFARLQDMDHQAIVERLRVARPDILLVAFGCPKQEKWIYMHYRELGIPCSIGVGATIDFLAGRVSRAPAWVARCGIEWIYRLIQEPRRLGGRYARDLLFLVTQTWKEARSMHRPVEHPVESGLPADHRGKGGDARHDGDDHFQVLVWSGALVAARQESFVLPSLTKPFIIDLSGVTSVDSSGLGVLLRLIRQAWNKGLAGCFLAPSPAVRMVVGVTKLERVLPLVETLEEARALLEREKLFQEVRPDCSAGPGALRFHLPARLTADNVGTLAEAVRLAWEESPETVTLVLDMVETTFMDSSGLGFLVRNHRLTGGRKDGKLQLENLSANVRNVIKVANLEKVLLPDERKSLTP